MFGKKKATAKGTKGSTVLLLDIESGSVASALLRLSPSGNPTFLAYERQEMPLAPTLHSAEITRSLERTLKHSLLYISEVAARMRTHAPAQGYGNIASAMVFLAAPWGVPNMELRAPEYVPGIRDYIKEQIQASLGDIPVTFYTSADSIAYGSRALGKHEDTIVASLRGELLELLLLNAAGPQGFGTVPLGARSVLRTLQSHGALTAHEAHSMLSLAQHQGNHFYEPLLVAGRNLSNTFADGAALLLPAGQATSVVVVGERVVGDWFAKHLAEDPHVSELFSEDSTVETLHPHHLANLVEVGTVSDPFVLLEALFVSDKQVLY